MGPPGSERPEGGEDQEGHDHRHGAHPGGSPWPAVKVRPVARRHTTTEMTAAEHAASRARTTGREESVPLPSEWNKAMGQHR